MSLIFKGNQPLMHRDFPEITSLTNLGVVESGFANNKRQSLHLYGSYHTGLGSKTKYVFLIVNDHATVVYYC